MSKVCLLVKELAAVGRQGGLPGYEQERLSPVGNQEWICARGRTLFGLHGHPEIWTSVLALNIKQGSLPSFGKENWPELASEHDKSKPRRGETGDLGQDCVLDWP